MSTCAVNGPSWASHPRITRLANLSDSRPILVSDSRCVLNRCFFFPENHVHFRRNRLSVANPSSVDVSAVIFNVLPCNDVHLDIHLVQVLELF
jgi:hypothetical protein